MAGGKAGRKQPPTVATAPSGEEEEMEAPTPTGQQAQIQLLQQQLLQAQAQINALQQQQQQDNVRFAVNPAAYNTGILDFDKKKDYAHQQKASESVFADTSVLRRVFPYPYQSCLGLNKWQVAKSIIERYGKIQSDMENYGEFWGTMEE